jgi:hypothetical protein
MEYLWRGLEAGGDGDFIDCLANSVSFPTRLGGNIRECKFSKSANYYCTFISNLAFFAKLFALKLLRQTSRKTCRKRVDFLHFSGWFSQLFYGENYCEECENLKYTSNNCYFELDLARLTLIFHIFQRNL